MVRRIIVLVLVLLTIQLAISPVQAEIKTINAQGEYRMGHRDTKDEAIHLATESAKRHALEQVVTYLESITTVKGMDITKDEIRTYTAGVVNVLDHRTDMMRDGETTVVHVSLLAQIDTEEAAQAIAALRANEDARPQLAALKQDHERLQRELSAANRALAETALSDQAIQLARHRRDILYRVESNAMVSQAWTNWARGSLSGDARFQAGLERLHALLQGARDLDPASPHVAVAERLMARRRPPTPPQPPQSGAQARMPTHEIVPHPGSRSIPPTLNEIIYRTPADRFRNGQELDHQGE